MSAIPTDPASEGLTPDQIGEVLSDLSAADWQRAKAIAGSLCGGVSGWNADDLLQEAMTKFLAGERVWPVGVHTMVVLKNAMHSIASNARKHNKVSPIDHNVEVDPFETDDEKEGPAALSTTGTTPEELVSGKQQIAALYAALAGDDDLHMLAIAWGEGLRGEDACKELGWDAKKYDAERKRLTRRLEKLDPGRSQK
ncbi:MAG: hypothetical protein PSV40_15770 [Polaromonas sp.]|uniref:hypothetical protein n=1 Tax=Polaromonas sp. TaxID=1869339 RepID=UPI002486FD7D|nr:hypothetical protein [Polaromonas sp.]MDI1270546.1 hypothetical protein [Polaromonas sp.]